VLDASALLALLLGETGGDVVEQRIESACISTVNLCEVITKLLDGGASPDAMGQRIAALDLDIRPFEQEQALHASMLRKTTRSKGLSLGDRACLVLAASLGCPALTADKAWAGLDLGIAVELIR